MTSKMQGIKGLGSGNLITAIRGDGAVEFETHYTVTIPSKSFRADLTASADGITLASKEFKIIFNENRVFEFRTEPEIFPPKICTLSEEAMKSLRASFNSGNPERIKHAVIEALEGLISNLGEETPREHILEIRKLTQEFKTQCRILDAATSGRLLEMETLSHQARAISANLKALSLEWIPYFNTITNELVRASDALVKIKMPELMTNKELDGSLQRLKKLLPGNDSLSPKLEAAAWTMTTEHKKEEGAVELKELARALDEKLSHLNESEILRISLLGITRILKGKTCEIRPPSHVESLRSVIRASNEAAAKETGFPSSEFRSMI